MMPRHCSVKGCRSNYTPGEKNNISTFTLPRDEKLKAQWLSNISTDFSGLKNPIVCIKHFSEDDIIRVFRCTVKGELQIFPRIIPKLKEGAVPCIFPNVSSHFSDRKRVARSLSNLEEQQLNQATASSLESDQEFSRGVLPVNNNKPIKKRKRVAVSSQKLPERDKKRQRPKAKRRKRRNPGARKLNTNIETVWLPGEENFVHTVREDSMESGECPVFLQVVEEPEEIHFKTELLTEGDNEENEGNPQFETTREPEAVIVKTEPFAEENTQVEQNPPTVDALELRIKEEPEDNTIQTESETERNIETVVVKEEITVEEPDVHFAESLTEYEYSEW